MRKISKLVALCAVFVTGIWLILNIIYAVKYIWGIDPSHLAGFAPYISQVDISAANTIIFFFTAWFIYRGVVLYDSVCKGKLTAASVWTSTFPFPSGFKTLLIQLGLLGTIFAFIIAFNRLSTSSPQQRHVYDQAILIVPLGAALWSSFAGVGFAFIVIPPIQKIFTRLLGVKPQRETNTHEIANLSNTLAFFGTTTGATTQALQHMLERTSAINQLLSNFAGSEVRQIVNELVAGVSALVKVMAGIAESQCQLSNAISLLGRGAAELRAEFQATRTPLIAINQALAQSAAQNEETRRTLSALQQSVAENNTASREMATRLAALGQRILELSGTSARLQAEMNATGAIMRQMTLTVAVRRPRYRLWNVLGFWRKHQQES
jgi:hypothetical protein